MALVFRAVGTSRRRGGVSVHGGRCTFSGMLDGPSNDLIGVGRIRSTANSRCVIVKLNFCRDFIGRRNQDVAVVGVAKPLWFTSLPFNGISASPQENALEGGEMDSLWPPRPLRPEVAMVL